MLGFPWSGTYYLAADAVGAEASTGAGAGAGAVGADAIAAEALVAEAPSLLEHATIATPTSNKANNFFILYLSKIFFEL